jgi:uncharacterized Zn-finger protein
MQDDLADNGLLPSLAYGPDRDDEPLKMPIERMDVRRFARVHGRQQKSSPESPVSSNKRYKCLQCSRHFTGLHNWRSHNLTHNGENPYVCQTCGLGFSHLRSLKKHAKRHTLELPYTSTCDDCGRRFATKSSLARHNQRKQDIQCWISE